MPCYPRKIHGNRVNRREMSSEAAPMDYYRWMHSTLCLQHILALWDDAACRRAVIATILEVK